ncbi:type 1 periplasmic binding fold superfamily protein [uncultured Polaribacter sp.]|uniref:type 1 periplasmic binding fold superfamily protein n=1 Tax=uncultured Polaribacter sp. TaxID=174711 RepID=UPI002623E60B|nr:type 1 periplasmic binding fold superfamily protein [uncultured Polaribacter sp.]
MKTLRLIALFFVATLAFSSCADSDDHDDDHDHEEELITTVTYTLTNGSDVVTLKFQDLDGEGGQEGITTISGPLTANTMYTGSIKLLNETESPAEDITEEIEEEDDEHEFFFASSITGLSIEKTDEDEDGNPVGLETSLTTGTAGSGSITVILKHEPSKPNDGTSASAGGSTDVEVTFNNVTVQ